MKTFFKINAAFYFSIISYFYYCDNKLEKINNNASSIADKYNFKLLKLFEIDKNYLYKMLKCCGNVIFNKKQINYFGKPEEIFPLLLYFHQTFNKDKNKKITQIKDVIEKQLIEYSHEDFIDTFEVCTNKELLEIAEKKYFKSIIHFLNTYYKQKKRIVIVRRKHL